MVARHARPFFYIENRQELRGDVQRPPTASEQEGAFRFSEIVPRGTPDTSEALIRALAERMTAGGAAQQDGDIPAGFTYLGQFIDHDLTRDVTRTPLGSRVTAAELQQARSPALDLDSVYGRGPRDPQDARFYEANGVTFRLGQSIPTGGNAGPGDRLLDGFDLPRRGGAAETLAEARQAVIADPRNDENLAVGQTHLAFLRFHNATVARLSTRTPSALLFDAAREEVTLHYQWMIRHDFLPRILDAAVLDDVFANGRKVFEVGAAGMPTMPVEFSVAAYRLGHSMIRETYDWNAVFRAGTGPNDGTLLNLFRFSGTSGNLNPGTDPDNPLAGTFEKLVSIWVADWTRLYDFVADGAPAALAPADGGVVNHARRIDTRLVDPLASLPVGSFAQRGTAVADPLHRNLAFRNLVRGRMVRLATAQEVALHFRNLGAATPVLTAGDLIEGNAGGIDLGDLPDALKTELVTATPLWFYVLREAELSGGKLGPIGGRIVAETFHRAIEGSRTSLLRRPEWRPVPGGTHPGGFGMVDLLRTAYDGTRGELRPVSPDAPRA
jgi:hypothetical protein